MLSVSPHKFGPAGASRYDSKLKLKFFLNLKASNTAVVSASSCCPKQAHRERHNPILVTQPHKPATPVRIWPAPPKTNGVVV